MEEKFCRDVEHSSRKEWLETNGLGGFASGTVSGIHTRRYHGLLTAALDPPARRMLLVAKLEDTIVVGDRRVELSANRYPGTVHPQGFEYLHQFRLDPFPEWVYDIDGVRLHKRIFMVHGRDATIVEYEVRGLAAHCTVEIRPLIAYRDYHSTTHSNEAINRQIEYDDERIVSVQLYEGLPRVFFGADYRSCEPTGHWYHSFEYAEEKARGLDYREDLFQPFVLRFDLADSPKAVVIVARQAIPSHEATALRERERARRAALRKTAPISDPFTEDLAEAADQFLVRRGEGHTVIAGYPWFGEWGRDTMIALPGLTLATGRYDIARGVLKEYASLMSQGMLPNRVPDFGDRPEYNTVDATLWFFEAVRAYLQYSHDEPFVLKELLPLLKDSVEWHLRGTRFGIQAGADGLLQSGVPGVQLTWMDAKVGDWVVTPRHGKPVEIQALWYNAIRILQALAARNSDTELAQRMGALAERVRTAFSTQFWLEDRGYLADCVSEEGADPALRPNQVIALSLHYSMVDQARAERAFGAVTRELLTPFGLRTLAPSDSRYRGTYQGGVRERDTAYHQGSAWPWLMGPYLTAYGKLYPGSPEPKRLLQAFAPHLWEGGLGQISELADGDPPHTLRGCIAQAWSVGELLRAASEMEWNKRDVLTHPLVAGH
jgi:predicted glycogen debranching enzyme